MDWYGIIETAESKPYVLGEHDCLRLACAVVEARTGVDYWEEFKGYHTKREALVTILRIAPSLREAISKKLGKEEIPVLMAQRGDIAIYNDGEEHIGICLGEHIAVLGDNGLIRIPITSDSLLCAWRIE